MIVYYLFIHSSYLQSVILKSMQWPNGRGALGAIALSSRKNLPFLKEYENQSKSYVDMNGTLHYQVFVLFHWKLTFSRKLLEVILDVIFQLEFTARFIR